MALTEREREILEESLKRWHGALVMLSGEPVENGALEQDGGSD